MTSAHRNLLTKLRVRRLKCAHRVFYVVRMLFETLWIPFAPRSRKKVAAVDVERRGDLRERICHRVDDVLAEHSGILGVQLLRAVSCQAVPVAPVKNVLFLTRINTDYSPHSMIVRMEFH